ncbi:MAG: hypothetical protein ABIH21_00730 [Patescibacteria group bacterium]
MRWTRGLVAVLGLVLTGLIMFFAAMCQTVQPKVQEAEPVPVGSLEDLRALDSSNGCYSVLEVQHSGYTSLDTPEEQIDRINLCHPFVTRFWTELVTGYELEHGTFWNKHQTQFGDTVGNKATFTVSIGDRRIGFDSTVSQLEDYIQDHEQEVFAHLAGKPHVVIQEAQNDPDQDQYHDLGSVTSHAYIYFDAVPVVVAEKVNRSFANDFHDLAYPFMEIGPDTHPFSYLDIP